jgi:hypothetical protein
VNVEVDGVAMIKPDILPVFAESSGDEGSHTNSRVTVRLRPIHYIASIRPSIITTSPIIVDDHEEWKVENVLTKGMYYGRYPQYLVK